MTFSSQAIDLVHAFAPSPVNGLSSIEPKISDRNRRGKLIVRSFEHGEIFAYLRFLLRRLVSLRESDPTAIELRFNCSSLLADSEHSMEHMAVYLRERFLEAAALDDGPTQYREAAANIRPVLTTALCSRVMIEVCSHDDCLAG